MRHGRSKAARKTLQFFHRTVGLKPPYSIVVDGNFVVHMVQHKIVPLVDRIDRVLQTTTATATEATEASHGTEGPTTTGAGGRPSNGTNHQRRPNRHHDDDDDDDDHRNGNGNGPAHNNNYHQNHHHHHHHKRNRYLITQAAVEELQLIHESLLERRMEEKAAVFRQALDWVHRECRTVPPDDGDSDDGGDGDRSQPTGPTGDDDGTGSPPGGSCGPPGPVVVVPPTPRDALLLLVAGQRDVPALQPSQPSQPSQQHPPSPYVVATQDEDLLHELRGWGTVPLVRLANNGSVLILEQPSKLGQRQAKGGEVQKWKHNLPSAERDLVDLVREEERQQQQKQQRGAQQRRMRSGGEAAAGAAGAAAPTQPSTPAAWHRRGKAKAKGPNPLSCKRKRLPPGDGGPGNAGGNKKRRDRPAEKRPGASCVK